MRVLRDLLRDGGIHNKNVVDSASRRIDIANKKCKLRLYTSPSKAHNIFFDKRSGKPITQLGNVLSPTWERFIPTVGTSRSTNGNIKKGLLWIIEQAFVLLFVFYPRYLKLLPPTNSRMMLVGGISLSLMGIK